MEYPHLVEIQKEHGGDQFTIVSVETTNRPELARTFVQEMKADFPVLLDDKKQARQLYSILGVPTNVLIDREGRIVFRHLGFSPGQEKMLDAEVRMLLKQGPA